MADIELVVKMPEEEYKRICLMSKDGKGTALYDWIANGTRLPKGHGRLKDIDKVEKLLDLDQPNNVIAKSIKNIIDSVPTIIETDYAGLEEKHLGDTVYTTGIYDDVDAPKTVSMTDTNEIQF